MTESKKYFTEICKSLFWYILIPNSLFLIVSFLKIEMFYSFSMIYSAILLPLLLNNSISQINSRFNKDWWYINYILICFSIVLSVFFNFFIWEFVNLFSKDFWKINNIDNETWMIVNLQLMIGCGITFLAWMRHMIITS
jgi:hypothetical protein